MSIAKEGFLEFFYLTTIFHKTKELLTTYLAHEGNLPQEGVEYLATFTLSHIDDMQSGFKWALRASDAALAELRYLLRAADLLLGAEDAESDAFGRRAPIPPELRKLQAIQHAKVVFGLLPRIPEKDVSYPFWKSYIDIPVPKTMADLADRITELERGVWDTATQRPVESLDRHSYRRVYGFFDAASWLAIHHIRLFQQKHN
ncbi:MAG: hypothetical protein M1136_05605 [Chloroflexi bacterium]|nr:hypothetical protein [Chloroflexota bacterium]